METQIFKRHVCFVFCLGCCFSSNPPIVCFWQAFLGDHAQVLNAIHWFCYHAKSRNLLMPNIQRTKHGVPMLIRWAQSQPMRSNSKTIANTSTCSIFAVLPHRFAFVIFSCAIRSCFTLATTGSSSSMMNSSHGSTIYQCNRI